MSNTPSSQQSALTYRREIDGLRAVAVLSVVIFHYFPELLPGGLIGVDIFFVISGFLISRILWDALDSGKFSFGHFYASRIRRIFPALSLVLLATWTLGKLSLFWDDFARLGVHTIAGAFFFSNFALWEEGGYFDIASERKALLHLWSLSIEEQFYLLWPLLLAVLYKLRVRFAVVGTALFLASFSYNVALVTHDSDAAFFNPLGRAWELILGALIGEYVRVRGTVQGQSAVYASTIALAVLLACVCLVNGALPFPGFVALIPVLATGVLLASSGTDRALMGVLSTRWAVGIGLVSYPLYLWHWPLFSFAHLAYIGDIPLFAKVALLLLVLVLSVCTYLWIECPVRRSNRRAGTIIGLVSFVFLIGALGGITSMRRGFVNGSPLTAVAPYLTQKNPLGKWLTAVRAGPCHIQERGVAEHDESCIEDKRPLVFLWGDSHAGALYPGLVELQKKASFGIAQMTSSGCPPLPNSYSVAFNRCDDINRLNLSHVQRLQPEVVILASSWRLRHLPFSNQEIRERCSRQFDEIESVAPHARIIIVGPIPRWEPGVAQVLAEYVNRTGEAPPQRLPKQDTNDNRGRRELSTVLENLAAEKSASFLSPEQFVCNADGCLTRVGDSRGDLIFFDGEHLNPAASPVVAAGLLPLLFPGEHAR